MDDGNQSTSSSDGEAIHFFGKRKLKKKRVANIESDSDSCDNCQPRPRRCHGWEDAAGLGLYTSSTEFLNISHSSSSPRKRTVRRRIANVVNSDSTSDSDEIIKPQLRKSLRQVICDSDTDFEDAGHTETLQSSEENTSGLNTANSYQALSEKCSICLSGFDGQDIATPETCQHVFCAQCLQEWAKKMNTCPIDRARFNRILVRDRERFKIIKKIYVGCSLPSCSFCVLCGESEGSPLEVCSSCGACYHQLCFRSTALSHNIPLCPSCVHQTNSERDLGMSSQQANSGLSLWQTHQNINIESSSTQDSDTSEDEYRLGHIRRQIRRVSAMCRCLQTRFEFFNNIRHTISAPVTRPRQPFNELSYENAYAAMESDGHLADISFDDDGSVIQSIPQIRLQRRTKESFRRRYATSRNRNTIASILNTPTAFPSSNPDIVGDILQMQTELHGPNSLMHKSDSLLNFNERTQQCPLNPVQETSPENSKSHLDPKLSNLSSSRRDEPQHCNFVINSSSSSMENRSYDSHFNSESRPFGTPRCGADDVKRSGAQTKEQVKKNHSDDEVDIYSDIESGNDEDASMEPLESEIQTLNLSYKPIETHSAHPADGTDSSDNDLVIDEDMQADDEKNKCAEPQDGDNSKSFDESNDSHGSTSLGIDCDPASESNQPDSIQSPDPVDSVSEGDDENEKEYNKSAFLAHKPIRTKGAAKYIENNFNDGNCRDGINSVINDCNSDASSSVSSNSCNGDDGPQSSLEKQASIEDLAETYSSPMEASTLTNINNPEVPNDSTDHLQKSSKDLDECVSIQYEPEVDSDSCSDSIQNDKSGSINEDNDSENLCERENTEFYSTHNSSDHCFSNEDEVKSDGVDKETETNSSPVAGSNHCEFLSDEKYKQHSAKVEDDNSNFSPRNDCQESPTDIRESHKSPQHIEGDQEEVKGQNELDNASKPFSVNDESDEDTKIKCKKLHSTPANYMSDSEECGEVSNEKPESRNSDLGIEDISDVASEDLNQPEGMDFGDIDDNVEKKVAQLFSPIRQSPEKFYETNDKDSTNSSRRSKERHFSHAIQDDREEGEIIDDIPYQKKERYKGHYQDDVIDDYNDRAPRMNISDLPRIPKIKKVPENHMPEEPPLETKRSTVLERVDLGSSDISWKRLSKHTKERSYRDGRPKDEVVMFRDREPRKSKKSRNNAKEKKLKHEQSDSKKDEASTKHESEKVKDRKDHSHDKKSERSKSNHDKSKVMEWVVADKREKEKQHGKSSHKDKYEKSSSRKDRDKSKKDKHEDKNEKSSRSEHSKHSKEKSRSDDKHTRERDVYNQSSERYERGYEKGREKEHKRKHKDHKPENCKKLKEDKHSHVTEQYSEKAREREVRKIDDKLKIVVEHKETRKSKSEKHSEPREHKLDKKHREVFHHHQHLEHKKKEVISRSYSDVTPIESKEIFAKGENIIINVSFNRASPRETLATSPERKVTSENYASDHSKFDDDSRSTKSKYSSHEKDKSLMDGFSVKRPTTPVERKERNSKSVSDSYWQDPDSEDGKSPHPSSESLGKNCSDLDDGMPSPADSYCAESNQIATDDEDSNLADTQPIVTEKEETKIDSAEDERASDKLSSEKKDTDSFSNSSRRRSPPPQPPSPPSPQDNDSYDPCEPTRSPSPPSSVPAVPHSVTGVGVDRPKPPPSPELPPLPPEPEPIETAVHDEQRTSVVSSIPAEVKSVSSIQSPHPAHPVDLPNLSSVDTPSITMPNVLMPPPSFILHSTARNSTTVQRQLVPPKSVNWQVPNHPAPMFISPSNHVQPVIRGNFLPSHMPTMNLPSVNVSAAMLSQSNSIPIMSQIRHLPLNAHGVVSSNTLLQNIALNPMSLNQMQMSHMNHPPPNMAGGIPHQVASIQNHPNSMTNSIVSQGNARLVSTQNPLTSVAMTLQNQHANLAAMLQSQNIAHLLSAQNQVLPSVLSMSQKPVEKVAKSSPLEKSEVVDMDVDSPYSPGDSPSLDSNHDYSPPNSPLQDEPGVEKDIFDSLLTIDTSAEAQNKACSSKASHKGRLSSSASVADLSNKKIKLETRPDSLSKMRHSVRLHMEKGKGGRKEPKSVEKREVLSKFDDSQLKILDELPSSAVEMQVKEKFLKKLNRQERVVEEVKLALKPYYKTRDVTKEEYKDILRKAVAKVYHNKSGDINPVRVKNLIESYVRKVKLVRKRASKRKRRASKFT